MGKDQECDIEIDSRAVIHPLLHHKQFKMKIYISEDDLVCSIQTDFSKRYPSLKLEFYSQPHEHAKTCVAMEKVSPQTSIDQIRMLHAFGWIDISEDRTAAELELDFRHNMGLNVQVFVKSGDRWIETAVTDDWSLGKLNCAATEAAQIELGT